MNEVSIFFDEKKFEVAQRSAKALAASTMVPKEYQNNIPNVLIAMDLASRMQIPPLLVMQNLYIVHGKPGWSAKYLIASFNTCGRFSPIEYIITGTPGQDDYGCRAEAMDIRSGKIIEGPLVTIGIAKAEGWHSKSGSKWRTIPDLMLRYRAGAWLINTVAPDISVGLMTAEEVRDSEPVERDITPQSTQIDDLNASLGLSSPQPAAPAIDADVLVVDTRTGELEDVL